MPADAAPGAASAPRQLLLHYLHFPHPCGSCRRYDPKDGGGRMRREQQSRAPTVGALGAASAPAHAKYLHPCRQCRSSCQGANICPCRCRQGRETTGSFPVHALVKRCLSRVSVSSYLQLRTNLILSIFASALFSWLLFVRE